jgi:hypothetical protein
MSFKKKKRSTLLNRIGVDALLLRILFAVALAYFAVLAILISFLGKLFGASIATLLFAVGLFIIGKWDRTRVKKGFDLQELLRLPSLNYWNILWIVVSILLAQVVLGLGWVVLEQYFRPLAEPCKPEEDCFVNIAKDSTQLTVLLISGAISNCFGGYIAEKLPNFKCPLPYRHAFVSSILLASISYVFMISSASKVLGGFGEEDIGFMLIGLLVAPSFALLGVWMTKKKLLRRISSIGGQSANVRLDTAALNSRHHSIGKSSEGRRKKKKGRRHRRGKG